MAGSYDARCEAIIADVIAKEGGFTDHPADRGGPTKFGITKRFLAASLNKKPSDITDEMIRDLTVDQARKAYHTMIWQRAGVHRLPDAFQPVMFTWIVMSGPSTPIKTLQRVVGAKVDGALGPKTAAATRDALARGDLANNSLVTEAIRFFINIVQSDPSQVVWLEGWFNRLHPFYK